MDIRIATGRPSTDQARAIERAFAQIEAEDKATQANSGGRGSDAWTMSGRIAAHQAASSVASRGGYVR